MGLHPTPPLNKVDLPRILLTWLNLGYDCLMHFEVTVFLGFFLTSYDIARRRLYSGGFRLERICNERSSHAWRARRPAWFPAAVRFTHARISLWHWLWWWREHHSTAPRTVFRSVTNAFWLQDSSSSGAAVSPTSDHPTARFPCSRREDPSQADHELLHFRNPHSNDLKLNYTFSTEFRFVSSNSLICEFQGV